MIEPTPPASFKDVIALWPSPDAMASDIGAGVAAARKWRQRGSIPDEYWQSILDTSVAKAAGLTADAMVAFAAREPAEARS